MLSNEIAVGRESKAMRKRRSVRIGVIDNGIHVEHAFSADPDITLLHSVRTLPFSLFRYDVVIVATHTDQALLLRLKKHLTRYLQFGGVLVLLGATTQGRHWLPLCEWEGKFPESISFDTTSPDGELIFDRIPDPNYLQYHSKYVGHGSLRISVAKHDATLAADEAGRVLMFVRRLPSAGVLLATTLDPDYHTSVHVPGPADEAVERTHAKAKHLLDNIIKWAFQAAQETPRRFRRRLLGWLVPTVAVIAMVFFYGLPVMAFVYLTSTTASHDYAAAASIVATIAFLGSLASIYCLFLGIVAKKDK